MSGFAEYDRYDAVGLAELVRKREVSAVELLAEARERCDRVNSELNAVVHLLNAEADKAASAAETDAPFSGVPFLIKDLGQPLAGAPLTCGSRLFANYVPQEDGEIIKRFKAAGLVAFGKTNVPEFGLVPVTEAELLGPCRNPWNLDRTPGGSSGGAASAVAAGIVPMAHASDGGGSIRIPASCCGLFGLKTSRGLNPRDQQTETIVSNFVVDHVVSRSVRDSAAVLDAICDRTNAGFLAGMESPPEPLKVAVVRSAMFGSSVAPEVRTALESAVKLMESLGHRVEDAEPEVDYAEFGMAFLIYWAIGARQGLDGAVNFVGRAASSEDVELTTWMLASVGGVVPEAKKTWAKAVIDRATTQFLEFSERFDVIMSPCSWLSSAAHRPEQSDNQRKNRHAGCGWPPVPLAHESAPESHSRQKLRLCSIHRAIQHDGPARNFGPARLVAGWSSHRHSVRRESERGWASASACAPTGTGPAMGATPAAGVVR